MKSKRSKSSKNTALKTPIPAGRLELTMRGHGFTIRNRCGLYMALSRLSYFAVFASLSSATSQIRMKTKTITLIKKIEMRLLTSFEWNDFSAEKSMDFTKLIIFN